MSRSSRKAASDVFRAQNLALQTETPAEEAEAAEQQVHYKKEAGYHPPAPAVPPGSVDGPSPGSPHERDKQAVFLEGLKSSEELQLEKEPVQVRETGFWRFKRVIVPPNAYVVHTRLGRAAPVTLGLGVSFRYNPYTDAYLVVPAAMQTIGVVANCISQEKQGINILAYVQWQIDDFGIAYRKLDFSDSRDPLGIVNAQLREQAEAAIKDKISTMSVEEVLTDKAPIIAELTSRLKAVAERKDDNQAAEDEGLGIKIVTVQIREAIVSSQRLWQDLQAPFRHEQEKKARLSYMSMQDELAQKELATRQAVETREAETMVEIERIKQSKQTEATTLRLTEEATRFTKEQEVVQDKIRREETTTLARRESEQRLQAQAVQAEQTRLDQEKLLNQQKAGVEAAQQEQVDALQVQILEARLAREAQEHQARLQQLEENQRLELARREQEIELARQEQVVRNLMNEQDLVARLIEKLPDLAAHMPEIHELRVLQTGDGNAASDQMVAFIGKVLAMAESMGLSLKRERPELSADGQEE